MPEDSSKVRKRTRKTVACRTGSRSADGKVLLHCTVAWRASHLWAAYLIRERKMPVETVLAQTRQINLLDERAFGNQQPLEGFLGRVVPEMAHPK